MDEHLSYPSIEKLSGIRINYNTLSASLFFLKEYMQCFDAR